jgi:hypothetical protein
MMSLYENAGIGKFRDVDQFKTRKSLRSPGTNRRDDLSYKNR